MSSSQTNILISLMSLIFLGMEGITSRKLLASFRAGMVMVRVGGFGHGDMIPGWGGFGGGGGV